MKQEIEDWKNSNKHNELKNNMFRAKQLLQEEKIKLIYNNNYMTREEILKTIMLLKQIYNIQTEDEQMDYNFFYVVGKKKEIIQEYCDRLVVWFSYLSQFLSEDDFEMCAELRIAIDIEKKQFMSLLTEFRQDIIDEDMLNEVNGLDARLYDKVYEIYQNRNNKEYIEQNYIDEQDEY